MNFQNKQYFPNAIIFYIINSHDKMLNIAAVAVGRIFRQLNLRGIEAALSGVFCHFRMVWAPESHFKEFSKNASRNLESQRINPKAEVPNFLAKFVKFVFPRKCFLFNKKRRKNHVSSGRPLMRIYP